MNQTIKECVYGMGTVKQAEFIARIGGMNDEETQVFLLIHSRKSDLYIQEEMGLSRKSFQRIEDAVRAKLKIAIFECINARMEQIKGE